MNPIIKLPDMVSEVSMQSLVSVGRVAIVLGALFSEPQVLAGPAKNSSLPRNESGITVQNGPFDVLKTGTKWNIDKCAWRSPPPNVLADTRLSKAELEDGAYCVAADFDGNGSLDFALWGKSYSPGPQIADTRDNLVVMFDGGKVIFRTILKRRFPLLKYGPEVRKGQFGEPAADLPGLVEPGEGDSTDIFLWDKKKLDFVHTEFASENN